MDTKVINADEKCIRTIKGKHPFIIVQVMEIYPKKGSVKTLKKENALV